MPWWRPKPQPPQPKTTFYTFSELYCKENTRVDVKVVNNAPASRYQVGNDFYYDKVVADFGGDPCTKSSGVKSWGAIGENGGLDYPCRTCPVDCTSLPGGVCPCDCVYELGDDFDPRGSEILRLGSGYNLNECYTECREDAYLARTSNRGGGMMQPTESQAKKVMDALFKAFSAFGRLRASKRMSSAWLRRPRPRPRPRPSKTSCSWGCSKRMRPRRSCSSPLGRSATSTPVSYIYILSLLAIYCRL